MKKSEETKKKIMDAAQQLFLQRGYGQVTMREIAKLAECSHTTIYLYFPAKETLLHDISMPYLEKLKQELESIREKQSIEPAERLIEMCLAFIRFGLKNNSMYELFMLSDGSRADEAEPKQQINKLRLHLFSLLSETLQNALRINDEEQILVYTRILFFYLNGCVSTYSQSNESYESLWSRLSVTFETGVHAILKGIQSGKGEGKV